MTQTQPGRPGPARSGVLCVGSLIADITKVIDAYPARDHLATIDAVSLSTGGPGLNMAVNLRRLGADFPVALAGAVGDDPHGDFLVEDCAQAGIDTTGIQRRAGEVTGFTDAMVERTGGRRTFFHHSGANGAYDAADLDLTTTRARILHAGAPGLHARLDASGGRGWQTLLRRARAAGLSTNLELVDLPRDRMTEVALPCLPELDSIVINELEAAALTGQAAPPAGLEDAVDWPALDALAGGLLALGVAQLAVVHFPAGCVAATPDGRRWRQGSVRVPADQVRSATGAGDAFAAGVLLGWHDGWPIERCLQLAVAAAAACVTDLSTSGGIRSAAECLASAAKHGYRPSPVTP